MLGGAVSGSSGYSGADRSMQGSGAAYVALLEGRRWLVGVREEEIGWLAGLEVEGRGEGMADSGCRVG